MSRSRLAPESLKRVSNLIPGILAGRVPDSDLEERNLGPPIALTTSYSFGVNVDEKSDTISSGYTRIYEDLRSTFLWKKKERKERFSSSDDLHPIAMRKVSKILMMILPSTINPYITRADDSLSLSGRPSTHAPSVRVLNNISLPVHLVPRKCFPCTYTHRRNLGGM